MHNVCPKSDTFGALSWFESGDPIYGIGVLPYREQMPRPTVEEALLGGRVEKGRVTRPRNLITSTSALLMGYHPILEPTGRARVPMIVRCGFGGAPMPARPVYRYRADNWNLCE